jgi:FkbH-like protein
MERSKFKKAIIFDCDGTLWDGVIGEGTVTYNANIEQDIAFLASRGVIIGICSKNNEGDVAYALENELLIDKYISVKRVNWNDKASNLKEIAEELNIGLDAIVFVDDSEFEVNLVMSTLPEVLAIFPHELMSTVNKWFDLSGDMTKTQQYKENYQRAKAQEQFTDINDYLASLEMILSIKVNDTTQIPRISELTQKTNQFNLTTQRYTEEEIALAMEQGRVYSLSVKDRFGDNGLTGVCIWKSNVIEVLLLSCRILGRGIEYAFMDYIVTNLFFNNKTMLMAKYVKSAKNIQTKDFYSKLGFELTASYNNNEYYFVELQEYEHKSAKHFRYE